MNESPKKRLAISVYLSGDYERGDVRRLVIACMQAETSLSAELRPAIAALMQKYGIKGEEEE